MSSFPQTVELPIRVSRDEYLEREREAETRSEYFGGFIIAMSGGSPPHNRAADNICGELHGQLKGAPCQAFTDNTRVRVDARDRDYYPDVLVVCGEPHYDESKPPALLNPVVVFEVPSPSTERFDRGDKLRSYQALASLECYVLVSQNEPLIEMYRKSPQGWLYSEIAGLDREFEVPAVNCWLRLVDIYDRVAFDPLPPIVP